MVFHVSDVSARGAVLPISAGTQTKKVDAAAELINLLLDGEDYTFDFLMAENLWWPGLTMKQGWR